MNINDIARPGIMISQVSPNSCEKQWETLKAIEAALKLNYFEVFQTVHVPFSDERKKISELLNKEGKVLTYCITRVLNAKGCNLSSGNFDIQQKNIEVLKRSLEEAAEIGAQRIAVISGRRPSEQEKRKDALDALTEQLAKICGLAKGYNIKIVVEPLDYFAHKKNTLGTTEEAVAICRQLEQNGLDIGLCIDTAHIILNNEKVSDALKICGKFIEEFHFCNCVTDNAHALYGDYHIQFGHPGVIGENEMAAIMGELIEAGHTNKENRLPILCEVLNDGSKQPVDLMKYCMNVINNAWNIYKGGK